jgi:dihydrolipoamide dehydrogenase
MSEEFDLAIMGAGPGGYVAAIRAGQLGLKTCVFEPKWLGGACLWVGCIPSKTLLQASHILQETTHFQDWGIHPKGVDFDVAQAMATKQKVIQGLASGVDQLLAKYHVKHFKSYAKITGPNALVADGQTITARNILVATGSDPRALPNVPFDEKIICSSTGALEFDKPPQHLIVIGAGIIGTELGSVWHRLGSKVTMVEMLDRICPTYDLRLSQALMNSLKKQGIEFHLKTKVLGVQVQGDKVIVELEGQKLEGDKLLVSIGRKPATQNLGLETVGVQLDRAGRIVVDGSFRTNVPSIFAIGDLIDGPALAHKASEEGFAVAELIAGRHPHLNYAAIPSVTYTWPELASVGLMEQEAKDLGLEVKVASFPFRNNPRGRATGETEGQVMLVAEKHTGRIVGMHLMGPYVSEMIHVGMLAIELGATAAQLGHCCFAHPTYSEAIKEAALAIADQPIHG